jgi:Raf kinase inhibitor-like YbhB/YbcL family protein
MKLKSRDFEDNGNIPSEFTCDGRNISPQLSWEDAPAETKSFALSVTDPDAPGGTWIHWLVHDVPRGVRSIDRGSLPKGAKQVENDFGMKNYGGPCPPSGTHRYIFTLYALDVERLEGVNKRNFFDRVEEHALEKAVLKGLYKRK